MRPIINSALTAFLVIVTAAPGVALSDQVVSCPRTQFQRFVRGLNLPWIKYGLDFGASGFGHFGLSSDCSEGFRPGRFPGSEGIASCERSQEVVRSGLFALKALPALAGDDPLRPEGGEIEVDLQDIASTPSDFTVDLDGETVSAWVHIPPGNQGDPSRPNFFQLFVKDGSRAAAPRFSSAFNVPAGGGWIRLSLDVAPGPGAFDPTRVRILGVKIGIGGGSDAELSTPIHIDQIESTHPAIAFDFEEPSRAEIDAARLSGAEVQAVRWFVFADGRASPEFDAQSFVAGLDAEFERDFDTMIDIARAHGVGLVPVLFDFLLCGEPDDFNGVPLFGRADLIRDPARWESFLTNALGPLLDRYGDAPEILYWEVINEPEWCLSDLQLPPGIGRPSELPEDGAVTTAEMQAFVRAIADFIHNHPTSTGAVVTLGSASDRYLGLWSDVDLDLCQLHFYNCTGCLDEGRPLPPTSACLLGEFAGLESLTEPPRVCRRLRQLSPALSG